MAWLDTTYQFRTALTVAAVGSALSAFPVLLDLALAPGSFRSRYDRHGRDLRITESDGTTEVPFEVLPVTFASTVETGGAGGKVRYVWFAVDLSTSTTGLYVYHDNPCSRLYAAGDTYGSEAVWSGFELVSHDGFAASTPDSGLLLDATTADGYYGRCVSFNGTDMTGHASLSIADASASGSFHASYLINYANHGTFAHVLGGQASGNSWQMLVGNTSAGMSVRMDNPTVYAVGTATDYSGTWKLLHGQYDHSATTIAMYLDGTLEDSDATVTGGMVNPSEEIEVGFRDFSGTTYYEGLLQEIRLYDGARSADWVAAEAATLLTPGAFVTWGATEVCPTPTTCTPPGDIPVATGPRKHLMVQDAEPLPPKRFSPPALLPEAPERNAGKLFDYVNDLYRRSGGRVVYADTPSVRVPFAPRAGADAETQRLAQMLRRMVPCAEAAERGIRGVPFDGVRLSRPRKSGNPALDRVHTKLQDALNAFAGCGERLAASRYNFVLPRYNHLFYELSGKIYRRALNLGSGTDRTLIIDYIAEGLHGTSATSAVAWSEEQQRLYFGINSASGSRIYRCDVNGGNVERVYYNLFASSIIDIQIDDYNDHTFFTLSYPGTAQYLIYKTRARFGPSTLFHVHPLSSSAGSGGRFTGCGFNPRDRLFFHGERPDGGNQPCNVYKAPYDSLTSVRDYRDGRSLIHTETTAIGTDVAIDSQNNRLVFTISDQAAPSSIYQIHTCDLDGSDFSSSISTFSFSSGGTGKIVVDGGTGYLFHGKSSVGGPNIPRRALSDLTTEVGWHDAGATGSITNLGIGWVDE